MQNIFWRKVHCLQALVPYGPRLGPFDSGNYGRGTLIKYVNPGFLDFQVSSLLQRRNLPRPIPSSSKVPIRNYQPYSSSPP